MTKKELRYQGKPIIRKGNRIFYGNLNDRYILVLTVTETTKLDDLDIATKVQVEIQDN